jgi:hypothetical protein
MPKTLVNTDANGTTKNVKDVQFWGNGDTWQLICKAWSENEGWMKSTKAMEIPGVGCIIQTTTQQENSEIVGMTPYDMLDEDEDDEEEDEDEDENEIIDEDDEDEVSVSTTKNGSYSLTDALVFVPGVKVQKIWHFVNAAKVLKERKIVPMSADDEVTLPTPVSSAN